MELQENLLKHLRTFSSPPYLFVGSGISRRYLGLENWNGLLKKLCEANGLNYGFLSSEAAGNMPYFATLMAQELKEKWWSDPKYENSRAVYSHLVTDSESALKIETSKYIANSGSLTNDLHLLKEIDLLKKIVVDGIVTTNWDNFLESIFPDHVVYVGQEKLIFSQIQGIGEIYKIHGTFEDPLSLIITQSDYEKYENKNPYLASKLLTFFVENPVVFLGYSLTDENVLKIIYSILDCLSKDNVLKLADRLVFVNWDEGCLEARFERTILTHAGRSLPVYQATTSSMMEVYETLGKLERKIPAKLLRLLKSQVYKLVHTTIPSEKIFVQDINENTLEEDIEFAIGVGILEKLRDVGYVALKRDDLVKDVVFGNQGLRADNVVLKSLPEILKTSEYVPLFKYLSLASEIHGFDLYELDDRVKKAKNRSLENYRKTDGSGQMVNSAKNFAGDFKDFSEQNSLERTMAYWPYLKVKAFKVKQIHDFLLLNFNNLINNHKMKTSFFKLVCVFDLLKYEKL